MVPSVIENYLLSLPNVSRETLTRWERYVEALLKWNKRINLIGPLTEQDVWERHILDCAQLLKHLPENTETISDFGTGGGLPGLILALSGNYNMHLVESNRKKTAFLHSIAPQAVGKVAIHDQRIEKLRAWNSDVITARALAPMNELLILLEQFTQKTKLALFLKGQNVVEEIEEATRYWDFEAKLHPSITNSESVIVAMTRIKRRAL